MVAVLKMILLLQWKNFKLKQRNWKSAVLEIVAPLLSFLLLLVVRHSRDFKHRSPACQFKPTALASKGPLAALQAFCYLGVCRQGEQNFSSDARLFNDSEYRNITEALDSVNKMLSNPTARKFASALLVMPYDSGGRGGMKVIKLGSLFPDHSALFDGVAATNAQKIAATNALFRFPRRWDLKVGPMQRLVLLEPLVSLTDFAPNLVCDTGGHDSDPNWRAALELCDQARFRANLKSEFDLDAALNQMASDEVDRYTIELELSDLGNVNSLMRELKLLMQQNIQLSSLSVLHNLTALLSGSRGGSPSQFIEVVLQLSRMLCGSGKTVFTKLADRIKKQLGPLMSLPAERFNSWRKSRQGMRAGEAPNESAQPLKRHTRAVVEAENSSDSKLEILMRLLIMHRQIPRLDVIVPPEEFCFSDLYRAKIIGPVRSLLFDVGLGSIYRLIFGVIPFYPETARTRKFLEKLNQTLQGMSQLSYAAESFTKVVGPRIAQFITGGSVKFLGTALLTCSKTLDGRSSGALCFTLSRLLFAESGGPKSWLRLLKSADSLMRRIYFSTACFRLNKLRGFRSAEALDSYTRYLINEFGQSGGSDKPLLIASLLFDNQTAGFVKYRLRFHEDDVDDTNDAHVLDDQVTGRARVKFPSDFKYFTSFFLHIQELLEHGIQAAITGVDAPLQTYLTMFPSACLIEDKFSSALDLFLPMIMTVSWIYNVSLLVNAIVYEKENRLKETMKIMGMSDGIHWISWFITSFVTMVIASGLMTLLLKYGQILTYTNPLLLFFFIVSYVVSAICEAFFISIFFSNSSVASAFAGVFYFIGYLPFTVVRAFGNSMTQTHYLLSCLVPQLAFGIGCRFLSSWELASVGLQYSNFSQSPLAKDELTFSLIVLMLWIDALILLLLTWYLEKIFPGAYGVPKPWYFPFQPSFWCSKYVLDKQPPDCGPLGTAPASNWLLAPGPGSLADELGYPTKAEYLEEEPVYLPVGVAIQNLTKIFHPGMWACKKGDPVTAVDNLTYTFYEGQVTSFLGHNGAGKTTTMSVLTGLYTPTSGTAFIAGHDIRTEMDEIRKHLGLCPQHNVLFDSLTVEDHIYFYGMLKGLSKAEVAPQIDSFIADVGLQKKKYEISKNLSGGMKRKLSVAMAFVGGSKVVVLDEPTAGVDPHARRAIWDLLIKYKTGRTIILTTHHMDEADILGDRICVINKGRLVCSGSPMFLKKVFGDGFTLTLVKSSAECEVDQVLKMVRSQVPDARLGECTSSEINVKLPYGSAPKLPGLLGTVEKAMGELRVAGYGIEDSSLEEIFLNVTGYNSQTDAEVERPSASSLEAIPQAASRGGQNLGNQTVLIGDNIEKAASKRSDDTLARKTPGWTKRPLWQQIKALWLKRFHVLRRSKIGFLAEFVLPAVFVLIVLALLQIFPRNDESPPMELAPWYMLGKPARSRLKDLSVFQSRELNAYPGNASLTDMSDRLMQHMKDTDFLGTRCMREDVYSNPDFPCKTERRGSVWSQAPRSLPTNTSWCQCSYKDYPNSAKCVDWPTPARKSLMSSDILESMQGYNLTNYIQSTVMQYYRRRFGGYTFFVNDSQSVSADEAKAVLSAEILLRNVVSLVSERTNGFFHQLLSLLRKFQPTENYKPIVNQVWYDNRGYVSGPAYLNILSNAVMRALANKTIGFSPDAIGVSGWTHPITLRSTYLQNALNSNAMVSALTVVSIIFALSFIPASFVLFLISERTTNAKQLQFVSGINPSLYWIVNHIWNLLNYMVPLSIVILLFVAFKNYEFVGKETIGPFLLTMVLFGFASAPLMYPFSWVMSVPSKAFTMLSCLNLGIGFTTTMSVTIVRMVGIESNDKSAIAISDILKKVFLPLPHFCLGQSLMELNIYYQISIQLGTLLKDSDIEMSPIQNFMGFDVHKNAWAAVNRYLISLAVQSVVYFLLVLLLEYNFCCKKGLLTSSYLRLFYCSEYQRMLRQPDEMEVNDDVRAEAAKIEDAASSDSHLLELRRLVKIFSTSSGPKAAVKGISLGVKSHECFGFLGVNGAGKTTTFKMLTGDLTPTSGDARVGGFSILTEALEVHKQLGYCPQFDALLPLLTGRETLQLYARIRGVEEQDIDELVETISKRVGIEAHLDKTTHEYSGGNKRKLSCGIAFIGNPPIVFLDEPTAGMDPGARRFLWRCIQRMVAAGSCVILTTHSMEDCQALCHRLTIMVNGRLQCIGSPQHLKNKFGEGFTIFLRVRQPQLSSSDSREAGAEVAIDKTNRAFMTAFPDAVLREKHAFVLQYQLKQTVQLRSIFERVQELKDGGLVLDYSVNQTTLDQVFISFANCQRDVVS